MEQCLHRHGMTIDALIEERCVLYMANLASERRSRSPLPQDLQDDLTYSTQRTMDEIRDRIASMLCQVLGLSARDDVRRARREQLVEYARRGVRTLAEVHAADDAASIDVTPRLDGTQTELSLQMSSGQMLDHLSAELKRAHEQCRILDERAELLSEQLAEVEQQCTAAARRAECIERNMSDIFRQMRGGD
jgi:hypothetical protein